MTKSATKTAAKKGREIVRTQEALPHSDDNALIHEGSLTSFPVFSAARNGTHSGEGNERAVIVAHDWVLKTGEDTKRLVAAVARDYSFVFCAVRRARILVDLKGREVFALMTTLASSKQLGHIEASMEYFGGLSPAEIARRERRSLEADIANRVAGFVNLGITEDLAIEMAMKIEAQLLAKLALAQKEKAKL